MSQPAPLSALLRQVGVFGQLDDQAVRLLEEQMRLVVFQPGEVLCREGEPSDRMFIIVSGEVAVLKQVDGAQPVEVAMLQAGEIAGVMSLFGPALRSATLQARGDARVWTLDQAAFDQLLQRHSVLARAVLASLSRHLRRETSVVARLLSRDDARRFKIAFFDSKPYVETVFRERNRHNDALEFFEARLTRETVSLAAGFKAVCVFVNDRVDAAVVEELRDLGVELIALRCAGFNNVDLAACERHGLSVARVPAYSPHAVAEHAAALMLTLNRRIHRAHTRVREGNFSLAGLVGFDLHGKTAGIVGTGRIGQCLAHILAGFGCRLLAHDVFPDPKLVERAGVRYVPLAELFAASDIISLHAPLTPQTRHVIDAAAIARMKRGVMLINTSRGALIDTRALLHGLKTGQIGYAGLDVYEEESEYFFEDRSDRVITDDVLARLMTFNNVIVTSHMAFLTREALANIADVTLDNVHEFMQGRRGVELTNRVAAAAG
ncbi:MAG: D-lactate dehydrogenase family protein [Opitutaceae bacterium]|nr:D-lactate dehydrogenase family protein [Opitutaceae bacterium]